LRRRIDIELESLDSIRLRVSEDVRIRIDVVESWDGSYRRAGVVNQREAVPSVRPAVNALYDSPWGRIQFYNTGEYSINAVSNGMQRGRYVFYIVDGQLLLELRPDTGNTRDENRMVYRVDTPSGGAAMSLSRIRIGTSGIHDLFEPPIILTVSNE
jgi:hypothetical protein